MNLSTYIKEIRKELSLTTFPNQTIVINFTLFVVIFTAAMAVYLGALDLGFGEGILKGINYEKSHQVRDLTSLVSSTTISTSTNSIFTK